VRATYIGSDSSGDNSSIDINSDEYEGIDDNSGRDDNSGNAST